MDGDDYHFKFKVVILGDKAVGKTSFLDCNLHNIQPLASHSEKHNIQSTHKRWPSNLSHLQNSKPSTVLITGRYPVASEMQNTPSAILWVALLPSTCLMLPSDRVSKMFKNGFRPIRKPILPSKCWWGTRSIFIVLPKIQCKKQRL